MFVNKLFTYFIYAADFQICVGAPLTKSIKHVPQFQNKP